MSGGLSVGDYKCCHSKKQGCRARMIIRVEDNKDTQNVVSNNKELNDDIIMIENNSKIFRVILNKVEHSCQLVTKRSICELDVVLPIIEVNSIVDIRSEMRLLTIDTCFQEVDTIACIFILLCYSYPKFLCVLNS